MARDLKAVCKCWTIKPLIVQAHVTQMHHLCSNGHNLMVCNPHLSTV